MKTLVQQVMINSGSMNRVGSDDSGFIAKNIMYTARDYAEHNGYDYKLVDTLDPLLEPLPENKHLKGMKYCLEMFLHLDQPDYDQILCLDADMYITGRTPKLPAIKAVAGAGVDCHVVVPWKTERKLVITGGFWLFTRPAAKLIHDYFRQRITNWENDPLFTNGDYHNEILLAEFLKDNTDIEYESLGYEWNWFHSYLETGKYIYHITGADKQKRYQDVTRYCIS